MDLIIASKMSKINDYQEYFSPEIKCFINKIKANEPDDNYEDKRRKGENDSYICTLIQNDLIDNFISYVNRTNYPIKAKVPPSIYETNLFLREKEPTLIEYAAFYGSIQIFKYLQFNNVELKSTLWLYAIHGKNPELIHLLEDNQIKPDDKSYRECLKESIKCHHNELVNYFENNYLQNESDDYLYIFSQGIKYYNFALIQSDFIIESSFFSMCKYDYFFYVDILLNQIDINQNYRIVYLNHLFNSSDILHKVQVIKFNKILNIINDICNCILSLHSKSNSYMKFFLNIII